MQRCGVSIRSGPSAPAAGTVQGANETSSRSLWPTCVFAGDPCATGAGAQVPRAFCGLSRLTRLDLHAHGGIFLPPELSQLAPSLLWLNLEDRQLEELPVCITGGSLHLRVTRTQGTEGTGAAACMAPVQLAGPGHDGPSTTLPGINGQLGQAQLLPGVTRADHCPHAGLSSLTFLHLGSNELLSLPDGPYLDRLQSLELQNNELTRDPRVRPRFGRGAGGRNAFRRLQHQGSLHSGLLLLAEP